jgi:tetratricopeptide (TPR) repeat protein
MVSVAPSGSEFFIASGALPPDSPSYVQRPADDELFRLATAGHFCYVLTPRQMGKSSLMVRTAQRLGERGFSTAILDLARMSTDVGVEQWYTRLIAQLQAQLKLPLTPEAWWAERASLGVVQRFTEFLHDVVLAEIERPVVIFVDEIDTALNLEFSDDFFAAIRFIYNARATDPAYNRLTFVLLGVATPADLIKDRSRTPFNIGQGIDLREFSREDAQVLQRGLKAACPEGGDAVFDRIFYWTNGHPYLTQKLCLAMVKRGNGGWTDERVDELVERLFLSEEARKETNLQFVRDSVRASLRRRRLVTLYRQVYEGKEVREDEQSLDQNRLKLYGLVQAERGLLQVRNEIYRRTFNLDWIRTNMPVGWTWRIAVISTLLVFLLAGVIGFSIYQQRQQTTAARALAFVDSFRSTTSAEVRITSLAGLFALPGYEDQARRLFYEELSPAKQLALFDLADPRAVGAQLVTVVKGLYTDLENNEQGNVLLGAMAQPLHKLADPVAVNLATEIEQWRQGRKYYAQGKYQQAINAYSIAISLNDLNPGTYLDRGLVYATLDEPSQALANFETALSLDGGWQDRVRRVLVSDDQLYAALWSEPGAYQALAALVPTPTSVTYPVPVLISPDKGISFTKGQDVKLAWEWKQDLGEDEFFQVRIRLEGQQKFDQMDLIKVPYQFVPISKLIQTGTYEWQVAIVSLSGEERGASQIWSFEVQ